MIDQLDTKLIRQRLEKTVDTYQSHAIIQKEIAHRILERLDYIKQTPHQLLDMSLHGSDSELYLRKRFPKAHYIAAMPFMAALQQRRPRWFRQPKSICMPFDLIPLKTQSIDFIFMNLRLLWSSDWPLLLRECRRVLMPKGMLLFTSLGPDTLSELRYAFMRSGYPSSVHSLVDMHDIGDVLLGAGFENPVMDMEKIVMQYASFSSLVNDLRLTGSQCAISDRFKGLMTPRKKRLIEDNYKKNDDGLWPASVEVIYGHAWAGEVLPQKTTETGEILVSMQSLKRKSRY